MAQRMLRPGGVSDYIESKKKKCTSETNVCHVSLNNNNCYKKPKPRRVTKEQKALISKIIKLGGFTSPQHVKTTFKFMFQLAAILGYGNQLALNYIGE